MDFNKICRCCLADDMELTSILSSIKVDGHVDTLAKSLSICLSVEMLPDDGFPQNVCEDCLNQIHSILSFKTTVINSKKILMEQMQRSSNLESYFINSRGEDASARQSLTVIKTDDVYEEDSCGDYASGFFDNQTFPSKENVVTECETLGHSSKQTPQLYYCTLCDSNFSDSKDLSMHCLNTHKQEKLTGRICSYCTERFDDQKSLDRHKMRHLTPFLCDGCLQSFSNSSDLDSHTATCILLKPDPNKQFKANSATESKVEKRVVCAFCGKSYVASYIRLHMLIHGDECNYKCKHCSKSFKTACSLNSHIIFNHKNEKNHKCQFCDLEFKTASKKTLHIRNKHFKEKNMDCPTCGKKFFSSAMVRMHMLTHSGEKKHVCGQCSKAYQTRYGLSVHLRSHHLQ